MFLIIPGIIFLLSLAGPIAIYIVFVPFAILVLFIVILTQLQKRRPHILPVKFQSWSFLPEPLRSLEPVDRLVVSCLGNWKWGRKNEDPDLVNLDHSDSKSDGGTKWEDSRVSFVDAETKLDDAKLVLVDLNDSDTKSDGESKRKDSMVVFLDGETMLDGDTKSNEDIKAEEVTKSDDAKDVFVDSSV